MMMTAIGGKEYNYNKGMNSVLLDDTIINNVSHNLNFVAIEYSSNLNND